MDKNSLVKLEFNLLYGRLNPSSNWGTIFYNESDNSYHVRYRGPLSAEPKMLLHNVEIRHLGAEGGVAEEGEPDDVLIIRPMTLSEIYSRYPHLNEYMDLYEESTQDYYRMIFNIITKDYYVTRALSNEERDEYYEYLLRRSNAITAKSKTALEHATKE